MLRVHPTPHALQRSGRLLGQHSHRQLVACRPVVHVRQKQVIQLNRSLVLPFHTNDKRVDLVLLKQGMRKGTHKIRCIGASIQLTSNLSQLRRADANKPTGTDRGNERPHECGVVGVHVVCQAPAYEFGSGVLAKTWKLTPQYVLKRLMLGPFQELVFLLTGKLLEMSLRAHRASFRVKPGLSGKANGRMGFGVLGTAARLMGCQARLNIGRIPGVEASVAAGEQIHIVIEWRHLGPFLELRPQQNERAAPLQHQSSRLGSWQLVCTDDDCYDKRVHRLYAALTWETLYALDTHGWQQPDLSQQHAPDARVHLGY